MVQLLVNWDGKGYGNDPNKQIQNRGDGNPDRGHGRWMKPDQ